MLTGLPRLVHLFAPFYGPVDEDPWTGERLVPGKSPEVVTREHFARYVFAGKLARDKQVIDVACGHGYGAAYLASMAQSVRACDIDADSIRRADMRAQRLRDKPRYI